MDSLEFARELHKRKCSLITASFVEPAKQADIVKGAEVDNLTLIKNQNHIQSMGIAMNIGEDKVHKLDGVHMSEDVFNKAVEDECLEVYTVQALNAFKQELVKANTQGRISTQDLEKAKKDIGKLVKVKVSDKNGTMRTVYVKRDEAKAQAKKEYTSESKTKEESDSIIKRMESALKNDKTPASMRERATKIIEAERKKWSEKPNDESAKKHSDKVKKIMDSKNVGKKDDHLSKVDAKMKDKEMHQSNLAKVSAKFDQLVGTDKEQHFWNKVSKHYTPDDDGESESAFFAKLKKDPSLTKKIADSFSSK